MDVQVGDTIAVETERVGGVRREGEVLEIVQRAVGVTYRVRWRDGHESLFTPAAGAVRVLRSSRT
ncbi:MAG: DUF1918 domain-containing protein [Actinobacteria bacterium]|nr:DUF1918 domain-containing protein [Actinomycetota bacterium]